MGRHPGPQTAQEQPVTKPETGEGRNIRKVMILFIFSILPDCIYHLFAIDLVYQRTQIVIVEKDKQLDQCICARFYDINHRMIDILFIM